MRVAYQRAKVLRVGFRMPCKQFGECCLVFQQALAPALELMHVACMLLGYAFPGVKLRDDGGCLDVPHQLAYVLHLAALGAELVDAVHLAYRIAQVFRQVELCELVLAKGHELGPKILQVVHLLLDLGLA